tara:strand:- start:680 stop:916 length:237 start_codon:yes stop_codon:yes gene_type:complete
MRLHAARSDGARRSHPDGEPPDHGNDRAVPLAHWTIALPDRARYAGPVFLMWIENIFPLLPSEIVMPLAGYYVQRGEW